MSLRGAFCLGRASAAASGERGVGAGDRHGDGVIHANQHSGLRRKFEVLALARDDVSGAAGKAEAETARGMAKHHTNESPAAGADGGGDDVALDVVLFLNHLAFFDFYVFAALAVGLPVRLLDGNDAHLHRDEAAIDFNGTTRHVHIRLAAKDGKAAGLLDGSNDAIHARTGREQQLAAEADRLGDNGDKRIPLLFHGTPYFAPSGERNPRAPNALRAV